MEGVVHSFNLFERLFKVVTGRGRLVVFLKFWKPVYFRRKDLVYTGFGFE